jgi:hypothetical protein
MHLDMVLAMGDDVTALEETDVLECDVTWLKAKAAAKGFTLAFAATTAISRDGVTRQGRRAAILVKGPAVPKLIMNYDDPTCLALNNTGRWLELLIPVSSGEASFLCTCAYGYSGASGGGDDYNDNETMIAHLISRASQRERAAQFICTDLDIDPRGSDIILRHCQWNAQRPTYWMVR